MVFFCCNGCGETLKKQKVEQHGYNCSSKSVSCIDCNVSFHGAEFRKHTQCVSEAERYQGHLYKATENKGALKQNTWMESVRGAAENCRNNAALKGLLIRIGEYDNVPRKQAKFLNFIRNSMRVNNKDLVQSAWDAIDAAGKANQNQNANIPPVDSSNSDVVVKESTTQEVVSKNGENKKKLKRKREEEPVTSEVGGDQVVKKERKKKKKKAEEGEEATTPNKENNTVLPNLNRLVGIEPDTPGKAKKYKMVSHIEEIVTKKEEISVKKLKRKVLAAYLEYHPERSAEDASLLFDKKIFKIPGITVSHGNVTVSSATK
eukprot:sb/3466918/